MKNRDVYLKDPSTRKLVNEGVANVNDDQTAEALAVLRYELETFVCDGQYARAMVHILDSYLKNIFQSQQAAIWISGFFGSGKSHLVKMLRALWLDVCFPDGATARSIARLPDEVRDLLKELSTQGARHGGLHAASGTLGAGASGSVRLALLRIVFKSVGLPEQYPQARLVMWLRGEGIYDQVREEVEATGYDWQEELDNYLVAEGLHAALVRIKPQLFNSPNACAETLRNLYPHVNDVSSAEMTKAVQQALTRDGKFPLTLIVLDEVQQFIGSDVQKSNEVREAVEACCQKIGGKLLFIGTGQTAVTGTANLRQLAGRFTLPVELTDADVEEVIRQVILAKQPGAIQSIDQVMESNLGEISRHLSGTSLRHTRDDLEVFAQDYPILPVRRRFWESTLRVLDQTGTESQLRNQLSMIHKVIQTNLEAPLGHVIPADYLYFDAADKLLQARVLPRKVHEQTMKWFHGDEDQQLTARACGLVFLITKLASYHNEVGIRADIDTLADLLVENLAAGSAQLRERLSGLLDRCGLLMRVGSEYRIQTEEGIAWLDDFRSECNRLASEVHRIEAERDDRIRRRFAELVKKLALPHGQSKVQRTIHPTFENVLPTDANEKLYVWVRDEWSIDGNSVRAEARQAGNRSATLFVFIPKRSADDLRKHLIDFKAASATLQRRGVPSSAEGSEARAAMETTLQTADARITELLDDAFSGARVFQAGGTELVGSDLQEMILEGATSSLQRLYPEFPVADHEGWGRVYSQARQGAPDALKALGYRGQPADHPVCRELLAFIGASKTGAKIRGHFEKSPHGWSGDAIDGGLHVLMVANLICAADPRGAPLDPSQLERRAIGKTEFQVVSDPPTTGQLLKIRQVMQRWGLNVNSGQELARVPEFLETVTALAQQAGGEPPCPERPSTAALEDIRMAAGNDPLHAIFHRRDELKKCFDTWKGQAEQIEKRLPRWERLQRLLRHAQPLADAETYEAQAKSILDNRMLLAEPDPVEPLLLALAQRLRDELNSLSAQYKQEFERGFERLEQDPHWEQLEPEQRHSLLYAEGLTQAQEPRIQVASDQEIASTLADASITNLRDRVVAMPSRFQRIQQHAAKLMEPKVTFIALPRPTFKTSDDIDKWLQTVRQQLEKALKNGPVGIE